MMKNLTIVKNKPCSNFYPAEEYHQNFYAYRNPSQGYCNFSIPETVKLRSKYLELLKP